MAATFVGDAQKQCSKDQRSCILRDCSQGAENFTCVNSPNITYSQLYFYKILGKVAAIATNTGK